MSALLKKPTMLIILAAIFRLLPLPAFAQETTAPPAKASPSGHPGQKMVLSQAAMCEKVENLTPIHRAVVFSVSIGQVCCFTAFDSVPEPTVVYHKWYHYDQLNTQVKLKVYPPKWATYSVIQLRETDKGPWHVEVLDQNGNVLDVIRFSITD
jgi:hypothetical protein